MDNLKIYEQISAIADALPDEWREPFALLLLDVAEPTSQRERVRLINATRRWAKDAGYLRDRAEAQPDVTWRREYGSRVAYLDNRNLIRIVHPSPESEWLIYLKTGARIGRAATLSDAQTLGRARILAEIGAQR